MDIFLFSVTHKEVGPLESCAPGERIHTDQECTRAATILGLSPGYPFSGTWPTIQSGCIKVIGLYEKKSTKNQVFYNYANDRPPSSDPNYGAICHIKETTTTTGSGESSFTSCNTLDSSKSTDDINHPHSSSQQ